MTTKEMLDLANSISGEWMAKTGILSVGVGLRVIEGKRTAERAIIFSVKKKLPRYKVNKFDMIPAKIKGVKTDVQEEGVFKAQAWTSRVRPAIPGYSAGHGDITAGTFSCVVTIPDDAELYPYMLSNWHVFHGGNARIGDKIYQPGVADGGLTERNVIGHLVDFVPLKWVDDVSPTPPCRTASMIVKFLNNRARRRGHNTRLGIVTAEDNINYVDVAIARPLAREDVTAEIAGIGFVEGVDKDVLSLLNSQVIKSGRTTEFTSGVVTQIGVTVDVNYGEGRVARFKDQIMTEAMSQGGDSGSLGLMADSHKAFGLLFAGSSRTTIFSPISYVIEGLNLNDDSFMTRG